MVFNTVNLRRPTVPSAKNASAPAGRPNDTPLQGLVADIACHVIKRTLN
jgi:hypothetical protein